MHVTGATPYSYVHFMHSSKYRRLQRRGRRGTEEEAKFSRGLGGGGRMGGRRGVVGRKVVASKGRERNQGVQRGE